MILALIVENTSPSGQLNVKTVEKNYPIKSALIAENFTMVLLEIRQFVLIVSTCFKKQLIIKRIKKGENR